MDTCFRRFSTITLTYIFCFALAGFANMASFWIKEQYPYAQLEKLVVYDFKYDRYLSADHAQFLLEMDYDFTSSFNWNTKQLFVYLTAYYNTSEWINNEVVVWNEIIQNPNEAKRKKHLIMGTLRHSETSLRDSNVTLSLDYRYIPIIGAMTQHHVSSKQFQIPKKYKKNVTY